MKPTHLISSLAIITATVLAAQAAPPAPASPAPIIKPALPGGPSHVTITIDAGGKKETREIDLGNATAINIDGGTLTIAGETPVSRTNGGPMAWLGVAPEELSEDVRAQLPIDEGTGLILRAVMPDSPAAQAGLQKNDVLVKFDDQLLTNAKQLRALVRTKKDGDKVRLTYFRGGKSATAEARIKTREGGDPNEDVWSAARYMLFNGNKGDWMRSAAAPWSFESKMVVVDKDGNVQFMNAAQPDLSAATAQVEKILRDAGVNDQIIAETKRTIVEALKAAGNVAGKLGESNEEVARQIKKATDQVAKSLEQARAAAENAQKQIEDTREHIREKQEKQEELKKAQPSQ